MSNNPVDKGRELTGLALLLLAILFGITYYTPASTGVLGSLLLDSGRGLLGVVAYALPLLFLYMAADYFISHSRNLTHSRFLHIAILFLLAAALVQAGSLSYSSFTAALRQTSGQPLKASAAVRLLWRSGQSTTAYPALIGTYPGGVLGGLLTLSLQRLAGHAGALVLLIGAAAAEGILLFNVSLTQAVNQTSVALRSTGHRLTEAVRQGVETSRQAKSARMYEINATEGQLMTDALAAWPQADGEPENEPLPVDASRPGSADSAEALNNPKVIAADAKTRILSPDQQKEPATESAETEKIELVSYKETKQLPRPERSALDSRRSRFFDIGEDQAGMNVMPSDEEQAYLNQAELEKLQQEQSDRETTAAFSQIPILSYDPETDSQPLADPLSTDHTPGYTAAPDSNRFVVPDFLQPAQNEAGSDRQTISLDDVLDEAMSEPWEADPEVPAVLDRTEPGQAEPGSRSVRSPQLPPSDSGAQSSVTANRYGKEIAVAGVRAVTAEQAQNGQNLPAAPQRPYRLPPAKLLNPDEAANTAQDRGQITAMGKKLEDTLHSFGVEAKVINITTGPAITRFELTPGVGVKVSRITNLSDDIALSLAAVGVRIEAPIPGKSAIGIEIPNKKTTAVLLRPLIESQSFRQAQSRLTVALGRDIPGAPILCDLGKMPHLLIAGATGSGKSVCINSILISLLYRCNPYEVKLLMIDPKVVELSVYNGIPHLLAPVVTDPKKAANTLNWAVVEMTKRYDLFAKKGVRDLASYNQAMKAENGEKLPLIILVIDELSDLMNTAPHEVEDAIARLTAMARAAGMHLIIATQRPSVDVITGVIKANIPSRIAFMVSSQVDSRTILDMSGAEKLLGKGDMLYAPQSAPKPIRGQGAFITEKEVERVVAFCKAQNTAGYDDDLAQEITTTQAAAAAGDNASDNDQDDMFNEAVETILDTGYASVSILQRRLNIGYPRAGKLIDAMERAGYIGPFEGSKPRKLLLTRVQWEQIKSQKEGQ